MVRETRTIETPTGEGEAGADRPPAGADLAGPELGPVADALVRLVVAFHARVSARMLRLNLTMPQVRALMTIRRLGRASGRQLARELGITPSSVVVLCDHLEKSGYVERVADTVDRRITWFQITPWGAARLRGESDAPRRPRLGAILSSLSPDERNVVTRVFNQLADALETAERDDAEEHGTGDASTPWLKYLGGIDWKEDCAARGCAGATGKPRTLCGQQL